MFPATEQINYSDASEFLSQLRLSSGKWKGRYDVNWIFRGHSKETYPLLPSLYRPETGLNPLISNLTHDFSTLIQNEVKTINRKVMRNIKRNRTLFDCMLLANVEHKILRDFVWSANKIGLPVPEMEKVLVPSESPILDESGVFDGLIDGTSGLSFRFESVFEKYFQPRRNPPLYAGLAQHHGIKTRLLDFTFNPLKAAYFACANHDGKSDVCVWAIDSDIFKDEILFSSRKSLAKNENLLSCYSIMLMPNSINAYLQRQEGLFIYPKFPTEFKLLNARFPSVEDYIEYRYPRTNFNLPIAFKMILTANCVPELGRMLKREGLSLATMMPTFDNVVRDMYDVKPLYTNGSDPDDFGSEIFDS